MRHLFLVTSLILLSAMHMAAQQSYTSNNKKAIKNYLKAEDCFKNRDFGCSRDYLKTALNADGQFLEAYFLLADTYVALDDNQDAIEVLHTALEIDPSFYPASFFMLGQLEMKEEMYKEAEAHFRTFLSGSRLDPEMAQRASLDVDNCRFAVEAMAHPVDFKPWNLGDGVNTSDPEYFPCITADNSQLLFTRRIEDEKAYRGLQEDFFISTFKDSLWDKARNIGPPVNTFFNEGAPTLSPDGQLIIFTACDLFDSYGPGRQGFGSCDLFATKRYGDRWVQAANLGRPVNTAHWETQPSISADGRTMYFIRGLKTHSGIKKQDIWVTHLDDSGNWSEPTRLPAPINTEGSEESVFIHPDGSTLYFSSDGQVGMGGLDIYVSRLKADGKWGDPVNLGYPINTANNENSFTVSADGRTAYFASDRKGGYGDLDLYAFELPESLRPRPVTYMKGKVFDAETKKPLEARFQLIDLSTDKLITESYSNKGNGSFLLCIPAGRNYALNVQKGGYMYFSESFMLEDTNDALHPFNKDVPLQPIGVDNTVVLKNVFFDTDKYDLKPESRTELDKLAEYLKRSNYPKIELGGHTDNQGDKAHNKVLSENRAKAVYDYLISKEVPADRLSFAGYGDTRPIDTNDNPEGRAHNRRTEYKILEIE